jgi:DNA-binding NarL/FixJ family response regulator
VIAPSFTDDQLPSVREMLRVAHLMACGRTNPQIAAELNLPPAVVSRYIARLGVRFGIRDRAGIVGAAIKAGDLQVPVTGVTPLGFDELLFEVLVRIAKGMSNQQIGLELHLSCEAVKSRVRRLLATLEVRCREEAVMAGVACGALRLVPVRRPAPPQQRERVAA